MNQSVINFWYLLELLTPFDLTKKIKESKHVSSISINDNDMSLPWLSPSILSQKFKLPLYNESGKLIEYSYQIYLGIFQWKFIFEFLQFLPKPVAPAFNDLENTSNKLGCFASFTLNHDGLLVNETLSYSTVPWSLKKIQIEFTNKTILNLNGWTDKYYKYISHLEQLFSSFAKTRVNAKHKMTVTDLMELHKILVFNQEQWKPAQFLSCIGYYIIQQTNKSDDNKNTDILNSFYLKDLEAVSIQVNSNSNSTPLRQYLANHIPNRVRIEEQATLQNYLSPQYLPYGRWPSHPTNNLALMQQCAVNLAFDKLTKTGGIFSVNGPPGTGKTTLLRDLIANLIVKRAEHLIKYEEPSHAFSENDGIYYPDPAITGFEIVVASSNNGAVENITTELPSFDSIDNQYHKQAIYFKSLNH